MTETGGQGLMDGKKSGIKASGIMYTGSRFVIHLMKQRRFFVVQALLVPPLREEADAHNPTPWFEETRTKSTLLFIYTLAGTPT